jgi:hypothetical protein
MLSLSPVQVTDLPRLFLINVPVEETPSQHIRNALQSLSLLKEQSPAFWAFNIELGQTAVHATAALMVVEHGGPVEMTLSHLRAAIQALLLCDCDWEIITEVPVACGRLLWALYQLTGDPRFN